MIRKTIWTASTIPTMTEPQTALTIAHLVILTKMASVMPLTTVLVTWMFSGIATGTAGSTLTMTVFATTSTTAPMLRLATTTIRQTEHVSMLTSVAFAAVPECLVAQTKLLATLTRTLLATMIPASTPTSVAFAVVQAPRDAQTSQHATTMKTLLATTTLALTQAARTLLLATSMKTLLVTMNLAPSQAAQTRLLATLTTTPPATTVLACSWTNVAIAVVRDCSVALTKLPATLMPTPLATTVLVWRRIVLENAEVPLATARCTLHKKWLML